MVMAQSYTSHFPVRDATLAADRLTEDHSEHSRMVLQKQSTH